jgi:hypothetical protein
MAKLERKSTTRVNLYCFQLILFILPRGERFFMVVNETLSLVAEALGLHFLATSLYHLLPTPETKIRPAITKLAITAGCSNSSKMQIPTEYQFTALF